MRNNEPRNAQKEDKNQIVGGMLYLVATPIGNLSDISERALKVLREVDVVAAEDTRNTGKLLAHFGISKPMISYFEHNKRERGLVILEKLKDGQSVALITDAGTPAISDPGEDLVDLCHNMNIPVAVVPGPCAFVSALALSGMSAKRFTFDSTGRIVLSEKLLKHANITDTAVFVGKGRKFQIWSPENWEQEEKRIREEVLKNRPVLNSSKAGESK